MQDKGGQGDGELLIRGSTVRARLGPLMPDQLLIEIRVRPNASRNKVGGVAGDPPRLVVAVQAPAVDGKANAAVIKELAKAFDLRTSAFTIVHGELARDKRVLIKGELAALTGKFEALCGTLF